MNTHDMQYITILKSLTKIAYRKSMPIRIPKKSSERVMKFKILKHILKVQNLKKKSNKISYVI